MALFGNPDKKCILCGKSPGSRKHTVANGRFLCDKCATECGYENTFFSTTPSSEITLQRVQSDLRRHTTRIERNKELYKSFKKTSHCGKIVFFDTEKLLFYVPSVILPNTKTPIVYRYDQVIDCEIKLKEGTSTRTVTNSKQKSGIGKAVVGGLLFGPVGAIAGGTMATKKGVSTSYASEIPVANGLSVEITTNDITHPVIILSLLICEVQKSSHAFKQIIKQAEEIFNIFQSIADNNHPEEPEKSEECDTPMETQNSANSSPIDEIKKYKELMDEGIITEEEFQAKKKQLLGI